MKKIAVTISEETIAQSFEIEITDGENDACAIDKAIQQYRKGELVLEPGEVQFRQVSLSEPYLRDWIEF